MREFPICRHKIVRTLILIFWFIPMVGVAAPVASYQVVRKYPHSTESYTEGLFYLNGLFYEGTGRDGHSSILVIEPETGRVIQKLELPRQYFGEGIVD